MMHLRLLRAALRARLARQFAASEVDVRVSAAAVLDFPFFGQRFAVRAHVGRMAGETVRLILPTKASAFGACRLLSIFHPSTVTSFCGMSREIGAA